MNEIEKRKTRMEQAVLNADTAIENYSKRCSEMEELKRALEIAKEKCTMSFHEMRSIKENAVDEILEYEQFLNNLNALSKDEAKAAAELSCKRQMLSGCNNASVREFHNSYIVDGDKKETYKFRVIDL